MITEISHMLPIIRKGVQRRVVFCDLKGNLNCGGEFKLLNSQESLYSFLLIISYFFYNSDPVFIVRNGLAGRVVKWESLHTFVDGQ